ASEVALLGALHDAVAARIGARLQHADPVAAVAGIGVAVVAALGGDDAPVAADRRAAAPEHRAVPAGLDRAVLGAAVAADGVAVVARFPRVQPAVAAEYGTRSPASADAARFETLDLADGAAAVARALVVVVALLARIGTAVAPSGGLARL